MTYKEGDAGYHMGSNEYESDQTMPMRAFEDMVLFARVVRFPTATALRYPCAAIAVYPLLFQSCPLPTTPMEIRQDCTADDEPQCAEQAKESIFEPSNVLLCVC